MVQDGTASLHRWKETRLKNLTQRAEFGSAACVQCGDTMELCPPCNLVSVLLWRCASQVSSTKQSKRCLLLHCDWSHYCSFRIQRLFWQFWLAVNTSDTLCGYMLHSSDALLSLRAEPQPRIEPPVHWLFSVLSFVRIRRLRHPFSFSATVSSPVVVVSVSSRTLAHWHIGTPRWQVTFLTSTLSLHQPPTSTLYKLTFEKPTLKAQTWSTSNDLQLGSNMRHPLTWSISFTPRASIYVDITSFSYLFKSNLWAQSESLWPQLGVFTLTSNAFSMFSVHSIQNNVCNDTNLIV